MGQLSVPPCAPTSQLSQILDLLSDEQRGALLQYAAALVNSQQAPPPLPFCDFGRPDFSSSAFFGDARLHGYSPMCAEGVGEGQCCRIAAGSTAPFPAQRPRSHSSSPPDPHPRFHPSFVPHGLVPHLTEAGPALLQRQQQLLALYCQQEPSQASSALSAMSAQLSWHDTGLAPPPGP